MAVHKAVARAAEGQGKGGAQGIRKATGGQGKAVRKGSGRSRKGSA